MIIDTHSHLNFKAYDNDRDEVIKRAQKQGVVCIDVGTKYETSKHAVELAEKYEGIFAAIGMHPIHIKTNLLKLKIDEEEGAFAPLGEKFEKERYKELAKSNKVVAIGEIGLDYYLPSQILRSKTSEGEPKTKTKLEQFKEKQKEIFVQQLDLAEELNLPVIIHCRMAHQDLINILKQKNQIKGVIHCFTGTLEEAQEYIKLGFYIGLNGIIFKLDLDEVIKKCPLDKILVETDCPYLTPTVEGKDKRNELIFVKHVVQKIADLRTCLPCLPDRQAAGRELTFEKVAEKTTENAKKLFKI